MADCQKREQNYLKIIKQRDIKIKRLEKLVKLLKRRILTDELIKKASISVSRVPDSKELLTPEGDDTDDEIIQSSPEEKQNVISFRD